MTRKEQIKEVAQKEMSKYPNFCITAPAFRIGAEWADHTMIDKACEWLDCYIDNYLFIDAENNAGIKWDDFINDFRKAMEGE